MNVQDIGPLDAKIMIVGEAPGREEEAKGMPFVGSSGRLLKAMCKNAGLDFNSCYITNVCNVRPPGNNFGYFYEDSRRNVPKKVLTDSWFELSEKVKRINPNVVLCAGAEPFRALTNNRGVDAWRGTVVTAFNTKIICTYHPAAVMRKYSYRPIVELDLQKVIDESKTSEYTYDAPEITTRPTFSEALRWLHEATVAKRVSFDIETMGRHVRCLALARKHEGVTKAICIPFIQTRGTGSTIINGKLRLTAHPPGCASYWPLHNEMSILTLLEKIFCSYTVEKVGQNSIAFDAPLLKKEFNIDINNHCLDTMHAWHVLYPELPKGLSFLSSVLTKYPNYWTKKVTSDDDSEWTYNAMDAAATLDISFPIEAELKEDALYPFYKTTVHPLAFALTAAQERGVLFNDKARERLKEKQEAKMKRIVAELEKMTGMKGFNPRSWKQVKELLYDKLKFPVVWKDSKPTTDEVAIRKLERKYPTEPVLSKIIEYRKVSNLISKYLNAATDEDGVIRTSYDASGTENGRISSSKNIWGTGMNLQNIPVGRTMGVENIRNLFVARPGHVYVKCDLVQAEAMVVAWLLKSLGDGTLFDKFHDENFDSHVWMASIIFKCKERDITDYQRSVGKLGNHSGNYKAGPKVLQSKALKDGIAGIDYGAAEDILKARALAIPGLTLWWRDVEMKVRAGRTLWTCLGRRRLFFGRLEDDATIRDAVAFEPQSTVGDLCNIIFTRLYENLALQLRGYPVLQVHDEVVVECKAKEVDFVADRMGTLSRIPLKLRDNVEALTIPLEISAGMNWRDCKHIRVVR